MRIIMDLHQFYMGNVFDAYNYLGAHVQDGGVMFRTFAPNAQRVTVIGEFNNWEEWDMRESTSVQFFELFVPGAKAGQMYKYIIYGQNGRVEHCDPYGFGMELRPNFASIVRDLSEYKFTDEKWMQSRTRNYDKAMNIYEMHLGSWKRNEEDPNGWFRYDEIADDLISYVKEHHFTHVEFMPLSEHPFDGSWGYQNTGFFSPTSRYGTAAQLMELVDKLHNAGIGAIIDFVPVHFALDYYGLRDYDGTQLYEYPTSDVTNSEWGSCNFIYARREVCSFMQSAAAYWLKEYHFDGIRMDAVSRLIYWQGDEGRGVNPGSLNFIKNMNRGLHELHPTAMLIAEDSTSYDGCTRPVEYGGLGFDYKWDLGWMNDTLDYFMKTSDERRDLSHRLSFSMHYYYNERHLLPLSHDEVVHGKRTIVDKIFGDYEDKFAQLRSLYMYMFTHPGKKMNFMGNELGMFREWDEEKEPDYFLLKYPMHDAFHKYFEKLGEIYTAEPALFVNDYDNYGFEWITINDGGRNVIGYKRRAGEDTILVLFNFSAQGQLYDYWSAETGKAELLLDSDWERWNGKTAEKKDMSVELEAGKKVTFALPAFGSRIYKVVK